MSTHVEKFPPEKCAQCGERLPKSGKCPRYTLGMVRQPHSDIPLSVCLCDACYERQVQRYAEVMTR